MSYATITNETLDAMIKTSNHVIALIEALDTRITKLEKMRLEDNFYELRCILEEAVK